MSFHFQVVPEIKRRSAAPIEQIIAKVKASKKPYENWSIKEKVPELFQSATAKRLQNISTISTYQKDTSIFVEGQKMLGVFVIRQGSVRLTASSAHGKSFIVGSAGPGEVLGLPSAISGKVNRLTAETTQLVECSFVAREAFLQFLEEDGNAALSVAHMLSHMYDHAFDQILFLGLSSTATAKFARLLLELPPHESANDQYSRSVPFTHKEIGDLIGASRETVTRLFARFKRQRLVRVSGSRLHILNPAALRQMLAP